MKQADYKIGAYCRLSRDDDQIGESGSIQTQRKMIEQYCKSNNMSVKEFYVDDGWSGTNFERPDFQRMIADAEAGNIDCIITKDLSRLGRDYIRTGYYTEVYFPENKIRYIAITDNYDTINGMNASNDIAPFKNLLNDMYAKDISKKIRSAKRAQALNGEHFTSYPPMGYKKDPNQKNHLIIDEETAWIIRKIFDLYLSGLGVIQLRNYLEEHKILTPSALLYERGQRRYTEQGFDKDEAKKYRWNHDMVSRVLHNEAYIGNSVHYRNRKLTNKSKLHRNPKEKFLIISDTHEPIISKEVFEKVQRSIKAHTFTTHRKHENVLAGIARCADCGKSMSFNYREYKTKDGIVPRQYMFCYTYSKFGKNACTCHHIRYDILCKALVKVINEAIKAVEIDADRVKERLQERLLNRSEAEGNGMKRRASKIQSRMSELSQIIANLYEDRALHHLDEFNFKNLIKKFQGEQESLSTEIAAIEEAKQTEQQTTTDIDTFIQLCKNTLPVTRLTDEIAHAFIESIYVHEGELHGRQKDVNIDIYFKFIGNAKNFN